MRGPGFVPFGERFRRKIDFAGPVMPGMATACHVWTAAAHRLGYGTMKRAGRMMRATHVAWELATGAPVPTGLCALHRCDNPRCVNAEHLFLGTRGDNNADRIRKGRTVRGDLRGERNGRAKLTADDVVEMRRLRSRGRSFNQIGRAYGIAKQVARRAVIGLSWGHVSETADDSPARGV